MKQALAAADIPALPEDVEVGEEATDHVSTEDPTQQAKKKPKKKKKKKVADDSVAGDVNGDDTEDTLAEEAPELGDGANDGDAGEGAGDDGGGDAANAKKKKKKKKGAGGGGGGGGGGDAVGGGGPTEDAQARFQALLDALQVSAEPSLADLSRCGIGDKKLRTLVAAMRTRGALCALTSLDLSSNLVTDAGAAALCGALTAEAQLAPQLTALSLAGNPIGPKGSEICAEALGARPSIGLVLPAQERSRVDAAEGDEAGGQEVIAYFSTRADDDVPPEWQGPPAQGADGRVEVGSPVLCSTRPPSFEEAASLLSSGEPGRAAASTGVMLTDAIRVLGQAVAAELNQPVANSKLLSRGLKWCSQNLAALRALLLPPPRPRVTYEGELKGDETWARRLGVRRLLIVEILEHLIAAKRPPLTSALADARPSILLAAAQLLTSHPTSGILGTALLRLLRGAMQVKALRMPLLTEQEGLPSLPTMITDSLSAADAAAIAPASRATWLELALAVDKASGTDKQAKAALAAHPAWARLSATLEARVRTVLPAEPSQLWKCGGPPVRVNSQMGGEMAELMQLLQRMPAQLS